MLMFCVLYGFSLGLFILVLCLVINLLLFFLVLFLMIWKVVIFLNLGWEMVCV